MDSFLTYKNLKLMAGFGQSKAKGTFTEEKYKEPK
jgi:hypothetical protein